MYTKMQRHVKKFRKRFNTRIIRAANSYSIEEIQELLRVGKSTMSAWLQLGLKKIDNQLPYLVWGQDLIDFLKARNDNRRRPCAKDQLFCCKCQKATYAKDNRVRMSHNNKRTNLTGVCAICGSYTNKTISPDRIDIFTKVFVIEGLAQKNLIECDNSPATTTKIIGDSDGQV